MLALQMFACGLAVGTILSAITFLILARKGSH